MNKKSYPHGTEMDMASLLKTKTRSNIDIIAYILQMANGGNKKSKIIMNNFHLKKYFPILCAHDLLYYDKKNNIFKTTPKGMDFIMLYGKLIDCYYISGEDSNFS